MRIGAAPAFGVRLLAAALASMIYKIGVAKAAASNRTPNAGAASDRMVFAPWKEMRDRNSESEHLANQLIADQLIVDLLLAFVVLEVVVILKVLAILAVPRPFFPALQAIYAH